MTNNDHNNSSNISYIELTFGELLHLTDPVCTYHVSLDMLFVVLHFVKSEFHAHSPSVEPPFFPPQTSNQRPGGLQSFFQAPVQSDVGAMLFLFDALFLNSL